MTIKFNPTVANEHEKGVLLGTLESTSKRPGSFEFYFSKQADYLNLIGNELYLKEDWEFDFETQNIFTVQPDGDIPYINFSRGEIPVKFVYDNLDSDWIYAEVSFADISRMGDGTKVLPIFILCIVDAMCQLYNIIQHDRVYSITYVTREVSF